MNSNDQSSFYHRHPRPPYSPQSPGPFVQEDTLKSDLIQIERKSFLLTLKENPRGRFLRITEARVPWAMPAERTNNETITHQTPLPVSKYQFNTDR